jgi:ABC-2 type transport system ATP-binding protein
MGDDTPQAIRAEAGTDDLEEAFLRLIRRDEGQDNERKAA